MGDPTRPAAWANLLSTAWGPRFPVDVETIAMEYSTRFPDPIKAIKKADVDGFEGALYPLARSGKWAILYNPGITSKGRVNFTLAHEFGHYLVHRALNPGGFECGEARVLGYDADQARRVIEQEADTFASYLLMPMDDYRSQIGSADMSLDLLGHCADRYGVSMTAAAIKWLDLTDECAVLVTAVNGFVLWCWRSKAAKRRRIFFPKGMELPAGSWAARPGCAGSSGGISLAPNTWPVASEAREMAIFADHYEMTISLLVFGAADWRPREWDDEEPEEDTYDRFTRPSLSRCVRHRAQAERMHSIHTLAEQLGLSSRPRHKARRDCSSRWTQLCPLPSPKVEVLDTAQARGQHATEWQAAADERARAREWRLCRRQSQALWRSAVRHGRMFKAHVIKQPLNRGALRIGAACSEIPIAMGMRLRIAHDHLAERPPPCVCGAASLPDKAGDKQLFKIGGSHLHRLAAVNGQASGRSRASLVNQRPVSRISRKAHASAMRGHREAEGLSLHEQTAAIRDLD